jgi:primosomal protein N' (replication factor Y)
MKYAKIVLNLPIHKSFHYSIPPGMAKEVKVGKRVWVPFGKRRMVGYIVGITDSAPIFRVRDIEKVIDEDPILPDELMKLTRWISDYYCTSLGSALAAAVPAPLKSGKTSVKERKVEEEEKYIPTSHLKATPEQAKALTAIKGYIKKEEFKVFLLHGITSSGKTEVYLQCISDVIEQGKSAIVLIPEISLTPQTVERFKSRFGENVAVIHSRMTGGRRFKEWKNIKDGISKIVVGARSALFSPIRNLGLIVVDEEHETSYKQEDTPRYHAREVAIKKARIAECPVILGSATPSLESYYKAEIGEYKLLKLTKRIDDRPLPKAAIIDMKVEMTKGKRAAIISTYLRRRIEEAVAAKKQVMLFLNRRGFSTYINCRNCGYTLKCKKCESVLVYHSSKKQLVCHYCNFRQDVPRICPECESSYLNFSGKGTEKIESEIHRMFPIAGIDRMDTDVTKKRGSHSAILRKVKSGKTNILVGTQMIAKGHDFPQVTLVGVISADVGLNLPDFRSSERTFNLLTQVGGRAGRGRDAGEVVIQTYAPGHYAITTAAKHDYDRFYKREIALRKELDFPPFSNIIKITIRSTKETIAKDAAVNLKKYLKRLKCKKTDLAGPAPGVIPKIRNRYIWNILIKTNDVLATCKKLRLALADYGRIKRAFLTIDVDPISL